MLRRALLALVCVVAVPTAGVHAHFIWLDIAKVDENAGRQQVRLYFSEMPAPGDLHLIGRAAATKAWARQANGDSEQLEFAKSDRPDLAALVATWKSPQTASIEAVCDYGVYDRGGPGVLLQYYAKRLAGDWGAHGGKIARAERLTLDIVPAVQGDQLTLSVFYQGKPLPSAELVFIDSADQQKELRTDAQGLARVPFAAGRCAVRAAHVEADRSGERDGKKYNQTWHYCTLIADLPAAADTNATKESTEVPAAELLIRARAARAVWKQFPGFAADVIVTSESGPVTGKIKIDGDGNVSLDMPKSSISEWVEEQLNTLVQHRMPDGEVSEGTITYADGEHTHPLGRKIDLGDASSGSIYRVKDDVIMEVNRNAGPLRFTISVLEITRNAENKYLPRSFTMNFFDATSGDLKTSLGYYNDWQRVGGFDLPKTILETGAQRGGARTRQILFQNCHLLDRAAVQAQTSTSTSR